MLGIYITAGYPSKEASIEALKILDQSKVDLIELGVPFSDPLADGPVIQAASHQALEQGMNLDEIFELYTEADISTKTILFSYYNPLTAYGWDKLIEQCQTTGISGILVPDLQVDEAEELATKFKAAGLNLILLAAITSNKERLERIYKLSEPFIYLVSRVGITGSADGKKDDKEKKLLDKTLNTLKSFGNKPIAIGFGIDSREKVDATLKLGANMAIIGTKTVELSQNLEEFASFIDTLQ